MSTLSVTDITTANGTTALSVYTGNASAGKLTFNSSGGATLASNSTVNNFVINATGNFLTGNLTVTIGGVQELFVNSTLTTVNTNFTVSTNTFTLGTSSVGSTNQANGYTYLPNGLLLQWCFASVTANSTSTNNVSLPITFTNIFNATASGFTGVTTPAYVFTVNTSTVGIRSTLASAAAVTNVYIMAIGR